MSSRNDNINNQNENPAYKRQAAIIVAMVIIVAAILVMSFRTLGSGDANTDFSKRYSEYNEGWTLSIDGVQTTVNLPHKVRSGEDKLITLSKALPDSIPDYTAIATRNYHQVMEVKIDGEVIYNYPSNELASFTILSDAWSVINLRPEYAGKTIEISLYEITARPFTGHISDMYYGDNNSVIQHLREIATLPFLTGVVMVILGLFLAGTSLLYWKYTDQKPNLPLGFAIAFFGVWLMNRSRIPYFSSSNGRVFFVSLVALLLVPPLLFLFDYYRNEKFRNLSRIGIIVSLGFTVFVLLTSNIISYNAEDLAIAIYVLCFIALLFNIAMQFVATFGKGANLRNSSDLLIERTELLASVLFFIGAVIEILMNFDKLWTEISMFFRVVVLLFAAAYVATAFWRIYLVAKERNVVREQLQESQLELMMGQIQPHFIFNTLSSIRTLVKVDPNTAYDMLYDFSNYLRANVDNVTNLGGIPFSNEVEHIKSYVNIEKVRFEDVLAVEYDIQAEEFNVPPLSIQPLVENAIKHGVTKKIGGGTVILRSYEEDKYNVVEVEDDGTGISQDAAARIFRIYAEDDDKIGMESNQMAVDAMTYLLNNSTLLNEDGSPIELSGLIKKTQEKTADSPAEASKSQHKSAGMINIILRLREISNAEIEITSRVNHGTKFKVSFPK